MNTEAYITLLKNSVYSNAKALELSQTIEFLGQNWFGLKEQLKNIKLRNIPKVES